MSFVPVIDFASCGLESDASKEQVVDVGEKLYGALRTCGFAYLKNSGISKKDVDVVNDATAEFFSAPLEQKMKYFRKQDNYGYVALTAENVDPLKPSDYKEAFNVNVTDLDNSDTNWPTDISKNFPAVITEFMEKCKDLAFKILKTLGVGMKLADTEHLVKRHLGMETKKENWTLFRSLYYPPLPNDMAVDHIRLGRHSDYGSITLLFQDNVGGLQIESPDGEFVDAIPIEDTVLINIGDCLESWSRNKLKSTKHRVVNPKDPEKRKQVRRSIGYFVQPDDHVLVDEELIYEGFPRQASEATSGEVDKPRVTALDYLHQKLAETY